ncbi:hypothetical protein GOODEAATRI_034479, partial [Goodea atripinnis]
FELFWFRERSSCGEINSWREKRSCGDAAQPEETEMPRIYRPDAAFSGCGEISAV